MVLSFWNVLDFLAVFPPLLDLAAVRAAPLTGAARAAARGARFDFRWFKALRALRVLRVSLLAGEMGSMHAASSGALLAGAASVRLFQARVQDECKGGERARGRVACALPHPEPLLRTTRPTLRPPPQLVASVASLLFTTSAIVNLVERIPFHDALYFVTTTLTTVGYGDVVVRSTVGKLAVLVMIFVGIVLIPVQTSQLYQQLTARRVTLGPAPERGAPCVLVSARLSDVRGFSDFLLEFFAAARRSDTLPRRTRMVVLNGKPDFEFRALQELNDRRLTLVEGSALSERDLRRARAESAVAVLLLADRFSPAPAQEDLNVLFQVWAVKSYTKHAPVYVQVLKRASLAAVRPFLDPDRDVIASVEEARGWMGWVGGGARMRSTPRCYRPRAPTPSAPPPRPF